MNSMNTVHWTPKLVRGWKVTALASQMQPASAQPSAAMTKMMGLMRIVSMPIEVAASSSSRIARAAQPMRPRSSA
jgi:hypothetical protein